MSVSLPLTASSARAEAAISSVEIPQLPIRGILAVWAAAAVPMAVLAWVVAPVLADRFSGDGHVPMAKALILSLAIGMVWQFVLVATLVRREQHTLRWATVREALWLRFSAEPAQRPRRRSSLARPDPSHHRVHRSAGAGRGRAGARKP